MLALYKNEHMIKVVRKCYTFDFFSLNVLNLYIKKYLDVHQPWRYNMGGGGITVSPFTCQVKSTSKENGALTPNVPPSTNHREELMITLYNYSSILSIIILDWH